MFRGKNSNKFIFYDDVYQEKLLARDFQLILIEKFRGELDKHVSKRKGEKHKQYKPIIQRLLMETKISSSANISATILINQKEH